MTATVFMCRLSHSRALETHQRLPQSRKLGGVIQWRSVQRRAVVTLLLLSSITFLLGLGTQAITDSDEAFYAEAAREMVEGDDWITPHFNYEERWQKPILYYWFTAAAFAGADTTEFMARFGAALSGIGVVLLTWTAARRLAANDEGAWIAGAIVATCFGYFMMARAALPDLPLAFLITGTVWSALRAIDPAEKMPAAWAALAGLAAGLGFLTKGPLALVIPAIVLVPVWWRERRHVALRPSHVALALVLFAIAGLPWYIAMVARHGTAYLQSFFVGDNLERFATTRYNDMRAVWYYVPILFGGLLPWAMFLLVLPWRRLRAIVRRRQRLTDEEWRLLIWAVVPLLLFTASVGKQPRYILPVLPPVAIMLGRGIASRIAASGDRAASRELTIATAMTVALFAVMAFLVYRARVLFVSAYPPLTSAGIVLVSIAAMALAATALSRAWRRLPAVMAVGAAVLLLTVQFGAFAGKRPEAVEEVAALIHANRLGGEPIGEYETFVRNLPFYTRIRQSPIYDDAGAVSFLKSDSRVFLVLHQHDLERLKTITNVPLTTLGQVTYWNTAGVRLRTILQPLPDQDLDTVVVVSNR
jgi:4-amino-4-deoxy-L-arabinose transferase-like glycosyltransferase